MVKDSRINWEVAMKNAWLNGIMGVVVGDALGVPVEFSSRKDLKINPLVKMA